MSELLPCPFCGGEADSDRTMERFEYCTGGPNSVMDYGYYVYCTKCDASMGLMNVPPSSPEEAAREWNRRAPTIPPDVRETIRKLADYGMPLGATNHDWKRWRDIALTWLDAQEPTP